LRQFTHTVLEDFLGYGNFHSSSSSATSVSACLCALVVVICPIEPFTSGWPDIFDEWVEFARQNVDLAKYRNRNNKSSGTSLFSTSFFSSPSSFGASTSSTNAASTTTGGGFTFPTSTWPSMMNSGTSDDAWSPFSSGKTQSNAVSAFAADHAAAAAGSSSTSTSTAPLLSSTSSSSATSTTSTSRVPVTPIFGGGTSASFQWGTSFAFNPSTAIPRSTTPPPASINGSLSFIPSLNESRRSHAGSRSRPSATDVYKRQPGQKGSSDKDKRRTKANEAKGLHNTGITKTSAKKSSTTPSLPHVDEDDAMEEDDDSLDLGGMHICYVNVPDLLQHQSNCVLHNCG
jgi:hypothetical protein